MLKPASNKLNNKLTNLPWRVRVYIVDIQKSNVPALQSPRAHTHARQGNTNIAGIYFIPSVLRMKYSHSRDILHPPAPPC